MFVCILHRFFVSYSDKFDKSSFVKGTDVFYFEQRVFHESVMTVRPY